MIFNKLFLTIILFSIFYFLFSSFAFADGLVKLCEGFNCFCSFIETVRNVISFLILDFAIPLAIILFIIGGILLATHGGSQKQFELAKTILTGTVIGLVIVFVAWLIINVFFGIIVGQEKFLDLSNPWYELDCSTAGEGGWTTTTSTATKYGCDKVDLNGNGTIDIGEGSCNTSSTGAYASYSACAADCPVAPQGQTCGPNSEGQCWNGVSCPSGYELVSGGTCSYSNQVCCKPITISVAGCPSGWQSQYFQSGISTQCPYMSSALKTLLECMRPKLSENVGIISSISDSKIFNGTCHWCDANVSGDAISGNCSHCCLGNNGGSCTASSVSCHYGGKNCRGSSYAVDFGDEGNASAIKSAAQSCGSSYAVNEGNHIHVSINGGMCGCQ